MSNNERVGETQSTNPTEEMARQLEECWRYHAFCGVEVTIYPGRRIISHNTPEGERKEDSKYRQEVEEAIELAAQELKAKL